MLYSCCSLHLAGQLFFSNFMPPGCRFVSTSLTLIYEGCHAHFQGLLYRTFLAGGLNKADPLAARDNKEGKVMTLFRDSVAPFINNSLVKTIIIAIFLAYLGVVIWGIFRLQEGLERKKLGREKTQIKEREKIFRIFINVNSTLNNTGISLS